ncbi:MULTISPECIES: class I SAM-dependent methyltransferase [Halorussus]|uniref:class I SAM-dependent methyltransferase n=1 Tax=Halorussus TaxID=1070314 RepID=UPI00209DCB4A|nr:class I SAM-dependent methyltransferase [Halorussus vallis]USZ74878.1 class I SAM-dependent methyltransferase [Halorussus vallis]
MTDRRERASEPNESESGEIESENAGTEPPVDAPADASAGASAGYDALAESADELGPDASPWGDSHFQRHYSWPAARDVLPAVDDRRVLLAGCGRGDHVGWFLDRGASVVGLDASEAAIRTARDRFDEEANATFRRADLTDSLDFDDGAFDLVFSHLVLGHVEDWKPVFAEFRRVLGERGTFAFAVVHPKYLRRKDAVENYYDVQRIDVAWPGAVIPTYYRPMRAVVSPLVAVGFRLEAFEEPKPRDSFREYAPERHEHASRSPQVLCVRARTASRP